MEQLTVGTVVEGTVKQITKFGAFVLLPDRSTGMVHISEIAHSYVNDIHDLDRLTLRQMLMDVVDIAGNPTGDGVLKSAGDLPFQNAGDTDRHRIFSFGCKIGGFAHQWKGPAHSPETPL